MNPATAYMKDSELLTAWLSVDPLADKYPSMSPYAYCAWNPVKLVDPDGRDWYKNDESSAVVWKNNNEQTIDINGESYNNIGKTYSSKVKGGGYVNYYQNHAISTSEKPRNSREDLIHDDKTFHAHFKSLSTDEQKDIFNARVASRGVKVDYMGVQFSGSAILGGGFTGDVTLGIMRNEGFFVALSTGAGSGFDMSLSLGVSWGRYQGNDNPSANSLEGASYTGSVGYIFYYQESNSTNKLWHNRTIGVSLPFKFGGFAGLNGTIKTF